MLTLFVFNKNIYIPLCFSSEQKNIHHRREKKLPWKQGENWNYPFAICGGREKKSKVKNSSISKWEKNAGFVLRQRGHLTSVLLLCTVALWREEEGELSLEKVSVQSHTEAASVWGCASIYWFFFIGPVGGDRPGESISSQHCRRTAGGVRSTQVHSTGGSRGPLGWL